MYFISMIFSVIILCNFEIMAYGDTVKFLDSCNTEYVTVLLKTVSIVLITFTVFFIWYASNIFLRNRKKEIGIYAFMGVNSKVIGEMYFIENMLVGISSCIIGILIGIITSKLFQIIVLKVAGYKINVPFDFNLRGIVNTVVVFLTIFLVITIGGFISICKSKIIDLINADKKNEKINSFSITTIIVAIVSVALLIYGFYVSTKAKGNVGYLLIATIVVVAGTYGFFGSILSAIFQALMKNKRILYNGNNIIAISNLSYRIRKNYRTFGTITIILATTMTVLGTAVAMKKIYDNFEKNALIFNTGIQSYENIDEEKVLAVIKDINVEKTINTSVVYLGDNLKSIDNTSCDHTVIMNYSNYLKILKLNGQDISGINEKLVKGNKVISNKKPGTLISMAGDSGEYLINDKSYTVSKRLNTPILGVGMDFNFLIISDENYKLLNDAGEKLYFFGIKLAADEEVDKTVALLAENFGSDKSAIYNCNMEIASVTWLKFVYAIGSFLFLVFAMATASIIYMKIYSDGFEDKERYEVLKKIGAERKDVVRAIQKEISLLYILPLALASLDSFFAINALGKFLEIDLLNVYSTSLIVCMAIFALLCVSSISSFKKIVKA